MSTKANHAVEALAAPQLVGLSEAATSHSPGPPVVGPSLAVLKGLTVRLRVVVGEKRMTVREVMELRESQVIELDRSVDAPVDLILDERVVARGRLVAVGDSFGVQITDLGSPPAA